MFSDYYPYIQDLCKVLIPSIITFFATKHSIMHPKKYSIREKQFNLVYLPLYLLVKKCHNGYMFASIYFLKQASPIINENYQYVFSDTIELFDNVQPLISSEDNKNKYLKNEYIHNQYESDFYLLSENIKNNYTFLKNYLGYHTKSPIETLKRDYLKRNLFFIYAIFIIIPILTIFSIIMTTYSILNQKWELMVIFSISMMSCIYGLITVCIPLIPIIKNHLINELIYKRHK